MLIKRFEPKYQEDVVKLVLHCQNDESRLDIDIENQADLLNIEGEYFSKGGYFWLAEDNNELVGTIGLLKYNEDIGILKKFFVKENYRGNPNYTGQKLFKNLLEYAKQIALKTIVLDTPKITERAHRFYEKAGFRQIPESDMPVQYIPPCSESDYFILDL